MLGPEERGETEPLRSPEYLHGVLEPPVDACRMGDETYTRIPEVFGPQALDEVQTGEDVSAYGHGRIIVALPVLCNRNSLFPSVSSHS
jgi:hypothetical protein